MSNKIKALSSPIYDSEILPPDPNSFSRAWFSDGTYITKRGGKIESFGCSICQRKATSEVKLKHHQKCPNAKGKK